MSKENFDLFDFIDQTLHPDKNDFVLVKKFKSGAVILQQDELVRSINFVKEGVVKCFITLDNGKNFILDFLGTGQLLGEFGFVASSKNFCTVVAITDVEVYRLKPPLVEELMNRYPAFTASLFKMLALRLQQTAERASYQQTYPAEYALLKFLILSKGSLELNKQDIAEYLGITKRNLNRKLKLFVELNILNIDSRKLTLSAGNPVSLFKKLENHKN